MSTGPALIAVFRRRLWWVLSLGLVGAGSALLFSLIQEKEYSASASILIRESGAAATLLGASDQGFDPAREAATSADLSRLDVVAERTARRLGVADVDGQITTSSSASSNVLSVTASDRDPVLAAMIANTFAQEFISFRRDNERALIATAARQLLRQLSELSEIERRGPEGQELRERIATLDTLRSVQTGDALMVDAAEPPTSPSSPRTVSNTALAAAAGLLLGLLTALLREGFDERVRDPAEVEETLGRPILGFVPRTRALRRRNWTTLLPAEEADVFRTIRTNLWYTNADDPARSILVTSPGPMDGKSTIAWNVAAAATAVHENVLLIEADLRHPSVAAGHQLSSEIGLSNVLMGRASPTEAVQTVPAWPGQLGAEQSLLNLDVLAAGSPVPDSGELLNSAAMADLLREANQRYDFVVVDGPPASLAHDAVPLMTIVGAILVVVRHGSTKRAALIELREQIATLNAHLVGAVMNFSDRHRKYYGYSLNSRPRMSSNAEVLGSVPISRSGDRRAGRTAGLHPQEVRQSSEEKFSSQ
jgi:succinoglycan biosynthesis transport protein ExoP